MLPQLRLSSTPVIAEFGDADAMVRGMASDFERGGVAIGDPTQGLDVATWEAYVDGDQVKVHTYPGGADTVLFTDPGVTELRLAFDQNMRPAIAFVSDGLAKLYWYDPVRQAAVITTIPNATSPVLCLDDKRDGQRDFSDILLFYLRGTPDEPRLLMRAQRDRYGVEYDLGLVAAGTARLETVGMAKNLRLRMRLVGKYAIPGAAQRPTPGYPPTVPQEQGIVLQLDEPYTGGAIADPILKLDQLLYRPPVSETL